MKKIGVIFIFIFFVFVKNTNAQAFQYPSNPTPSFFIMDSSIEKAFAFTDTLLKGSHSLYLLQSIDSFFKTTPAFKFHYVDGNGTQLDFIYDYNKKRNIYFIEVDGRKADVVDLFNRYFHTQHEWKTETENGNVREFIFGQKTYFLKMAENKNADGEPLGTVKSAIMSN